MPEQMDRKSCHHLFEDRVILSGMKSDNYPQTKQPVKEIIAIPETIRSFIPPSLA